MMANKSLRSTLNQNTFLTIFAVGLATIISVLAFSYFKTKVLQRSMIESLLKSSAHEVDLLLPTILLPEQEAGAKLILERIKENEELESSE